MYTVTFYSFKGGVGRTLALANVGLELARTGRRVLLVDFDLEAPGLSTFDLLRPEKPQSGVVEYVSSYIRTNTAPDAMDFIYEVLGVGGKGGRLWVMPAGKEDKEYSRNLASINWQQLYAEFNGYLMFEDLKAQWNKSLKPDYVLIDSRTGHTDIGGICTRQLPDSVIILFFPNEQNLAGLIPIVSAITAEQNQISNKHIKLHFVMSNVPDLDDEQDILASIQHRFQTKLGYDKLTQVIHRYDSMHLLNQSLFIVDRPKSRLAKEYVALMESITENNPEDREAVIRTLTSKRFYGSLPTQSQKDRVEEILKYHSGDKEILYFLAMDLKRRGRREQSASFLKKSLELGYRSPEALLAQAELTIQERKPSEIADDVFEAFQSQELSMDDIASGIEIIRRFVPERISKIIETPAFRAIDPTTNALLSYELMWSREGAEAVVRWLSNTLKNRGNYASQVRIVRNPLTLAMISIARFEEALKLFGDIRPVPGDLSIDDAFNYGMAEWGINGTPSKDMFEQVIKIDTIKPRRLSSANHRQCLAISSWVIGKKDEALINLDWATKEIARIPTQEFSCWRYLQVAPSEFKKDCDSIKSLIDGQNILPLFMQK